MSPMITGAFHGSLIASIVFIPVVYVAIWLRKKTALSRIPSQWWDTSLMLMMSFFLGLAVIDRAHASAVQQQLDFNFGHVFLLLVGGSLVILVAAFGTGKIEENRPENEQLRERGIIAVILIIGTAIGGLVTSVGYL